MGSFGWTSRRRMEGAIEKNGTQEGLLEAPADNSHFHKSKHFQEGFPSSSTSSSATSSSTVSSFSSSSTSVRKELMELFDRIQREVEEQKYNKEEEEEEKFEIRKRMELAQ